MNVSTNKQTKNQMSICQTDIVLFMSNHVRIFIILIVFSFVIFCVSPLTQTRTLRVLMDNFVLKARNKGTNYLTLKIERVLFFCLEARNSLQGLCLIRPQPSFKVFDVYD